MAWSAVRTSCCCFGRCISMPPMGEEGLALPIFQRRLRHFPHLSFPLCPLLGCHQLSSALHMLLGCQIHTISNMKNELHNIAGKMAREALGKSPRGPGLVIMDIGMMLGWRSTT
eukprot:1151760-Pelagomonas_calceolata.AAC.3